MIATKSILVIDDEDSICLAFGRFFADRGWRVHTAASAGEGLRCCGEHRPALVFLDVRLPDRSGLDLLPELAAHGCDVVMITAYGGLDTAVRSIQGRAYDYLVKPLDLDKALAIAERAWQWRLAQGEGDSIAAPAAELLVGQSPAMQEIYKLIARAAETASPVLIEGATGTGKELVARAIHQFSARRDKPFVALNCGAIPEPLIESELFGHLRGSFTGADADRAGRFEAADGGTLLLDEVSELPPSAQVKLLRVLDSGVVERLGSCQPIQLDVRVLAATNRPLSALVSAGGFRPDLFYRLAVLPICLPRLCQRKEDIPALAAHFLAANTPAGQTPPRLGEDALARLMSHDWPGNVRELKNVMEHALTVGPDGVVTAADLPRSLLEAPAGCAADESPLQKAALQYLDSLGEAGAKYHHLLKVVETAAIRDALARCRGNQSEAAEYLGLHRNTLRNKLREFGAEFE